MMALIVAAALATQTTPDIQIGPYYTDCPNGIAFIENGKQVALLRIGWVVDGKYESDYGALTAAGRELHYGLSAPDGSYQELSWKVKETTIKLRWGKSPAGRIAGEVSVDRAVRLVLEAGGATPTCFADAGPALLVSPGALFFADPAEHHPVTALTAASHDELALKIAGAEITKRTPDKNLAAGLVFDVRPGKVLNIYGQLSGLSPEKTRFLDQARSRALKSVPAATGPWGDFLAPISACMHFSKTFNPETKLIAHTVSRGWFRLDGQVLFCWDSFFNGLLASLDDPEGAKGTVRAVLAAATPEGFVANFSGRPWGRSDDRSQPPVGAMCVWKMHQRHPDAAFLGEVYPKLVKWHDWWFKKRPDTGKPMRDGNNDGLLEWGSETGDLQNAKFESGLDDSPMFDDAGMDGPNMTLDSVDLSSLWAMDAEYLGYIADALDKPNDAKRFRKEREDMAKRIDELLWNDELGLYCNRLWKPVPKTDPVKLEELTTTDGKAGFKGEYYAGRNFETPKFTRQDAKIDFNWEDKSPDPTLGKESYSVRWTSTFTPMLAGKYTFKTNSDDGVRLWVNGKLVIDDWTIHAPQTDTAEPIELRAGQGCEIKVEYYQAEGGAQIHLSAVHVDANAPLRHFSTRLSPCNFYPMIAGVPSKEKAERMLKILEDPKKFWGEFVCPTIARDDPAFPQQHYWRGKIWAPSNYLMWIGLKRYAPGSVLSDFAKKSVALFMRNWNKDGTCHENFLSNGEGSSDPHYTWGALMCLIGLEAVLDIQPDGKVKKNEHLGISVKNIPIAGKQQTVKAKA